MVDFVNPSLSPQSSAPLLTDTRFYLETPEGADISIQPAGVVVRILAYLIDFLVRVGVGIFFSIFLGVLGDFGVGFFLIIFFLLEWFYPVFFEVYRDGKTPGKKYMGLRVIHEDSTPVSFPSSLIRNLLRFVDFLPSFYVVGMIASMVNRRFQRLGDLAAGTMVIYEQEKLILPDIDVVGTPISAPTDFSTDEQRVLIEFAERSGTLSQDRQRELAQQLAPIFGNKDTVNTLKRIAKHLVDPT